MKAYILYKIDDVQQPIQFEQITDYYQLNVIFAPFFINFSIPFYQGEIQNPTVKVSTLPPKNESQWQKYNFQCFEGITIYSKLQNNKLYFYYYIQYFKPEHHRFLKVMIFHSLLTSYILRKNNLLLAHSMTLNNGDVIVGIPTAGKTTLHNRINKNNSYVKSLCDEDTIIDIKNKIVYPVPRLYETEIVNFNNPIKIKRLMVLKQGQEEKIEQIQQKEWKQALFESSVYQIYHPFLNRIYKLDYSKSQIWVDCRKGLRQQAEEKIKKIVSSINDIKYLSIITNTNDINQKVNIIQDNIKDVLC